MPSRLLTRATLLLAVVWGCGGVVAGCDVATYDPDNGIFYKCDSHTDCISGYACVEAENEQAETPGSNSVSVCLRLCPADLYCGAGWQCVTAEVESAPGPGGEQTLEVCAPDGLAPAAGAPPS